MAEEDFCRASFEPPTSPQRAGEGQRATLEGKTKLGGLCVVGQPSAARPTNPSSGPPPHLKIEHVRTEMSLAGVIMSIPGQSVHSTVGRAFGASGIT